MGYVNLQLVALVAAKKANLSRYVWPPIFRGIKHFVAAESIGNTPSLAARIVLNELLPGASLIAGGYAAYKCGFTTEYGDIDIFTAVHEGESERIARQIAHSLSDVYGIPCSNAKQIYSKGHAERYVVKVPALSPKHPLYNEHDGAACDIVIVEANEGLGSAREIGAAIVGDFDIDVCKCIGIPIQMICDGIKSNDIIYMPSMTKIDVTTNMEVHMRADCPQLDGRRNGTYVVGNGTSNGLVCRGRKGNAEDAGMENQEYRDDGEMMEIDIGSAAVCDANMIHEDEDEVGRQLMSEDKENDDDNLMAGLHEDTGEEAMKLTCGAGDNMNGENMVDDCSDITCGEIGETDGELYIRGTEELNDEGSREEVDSCTLEELILAYEYALEHEAEVEHDMILAEQYGGKKSSYEEMVLIAAGHNGGQKSRHEEMVLSSVGDMREDFVLLPKGKNKEGGRAGFAKNSRLTIWEKEQLNQQGANKSSRDSGADLHGDCDVNELKVCQGNNDGKVSQRELDCCNENFRAKKYRKRLAPELQYYENLEEMIKGAVEKLWGIMP